MIEWWLWFPPAAILLLMVFILTGWYLWDRHMFNTDTEEVLEELDKEWATKVHNMVETERLGATGELDLVWFQTHIELTEIEERTIAEAVNCIDSTIEILLDDSKWSVLSAKRENTPNARDAIVSIVPPVIPGRTTSVSVGRHRKDG